MITLAIESATNNLGIAILNKNKVITSFEVDSGMSHSLNIMNVVSHSFNVSTIDKNNIDMIAVDVGPGAFTSLRGGVSTARALAQFIGCPIVPVNSLDVLKEAVFNILDKEAIIIPMIDGRKERVYSSIYHYNKALVKDLDIGIERLIDKIKGLNQESIVFGSGAILYRNLLKDTIRNLITFLPDEYNKPHSIYVGLLAIKKFLKDGGLNYNQVVPNYIRKSDAELKS